jgi:hypothetical protein
MLNKFVNFNFSFTKHSGIDPCEKQINIQGGHAGRHISMTCSKLEAMAIYLVKQACGYDKLACHVCSLFFSYFFSSPNPKIYLPFFSFFHFSKVSSFFLNLVEKNPNNHQKIADKSDLPKLNPYWAVGRSENPRGGQVAMWLA